MTSTTNGKEESDKLSCKWLDCHWKATLADEDLLEHIRASHSRQQPYKDRKAAQDAHKGKLTALPKDLEGFFVCLWRGCRVYQKPSISTGWFERHILDHAGKRPFKCFIDGCTARFKRPGALDKHVNSHFNQTNTANSHTTANPHHNHHNGHHHHHHCHNHHHHHHHHGHNHRHHHHASDPRHHNGHHNGQKPHRHQYGQQNGHHNGHLNHPETSNDADHSELVPGPTSSERSSKEESPNVDKVVSLDHDEDKKNAHQHQNDPSGGDTSKRNRNSRIQTGKNQFKKDFSHRKDFFHEGIMEYITHYLLVETLKRRKKE